MKFKILKGTELFKKFDLLKQKMHAANEAARALVNTIECESFCASTNMYAIAGGISAFKLKEKRLGWTRVFKDHYKDMYFPQPNLLANKDLVQQIDDLPLIGTDELNEIVGYKAQSFPRNGKSVHVFCPVCYFRDEYILLSFNENINFTPVCDMIEITVTEFKSLQNEDKTTIALAEA